MEDRVAGGRIIRESDRIAELVSAAWTECAGRSLIGKSEHIQPRAFRAKISGLNEKPPSELALNSQTPGLRIRRAVAPVDRKRVRHVAAGSSVKTAGEAARIRQAWLHIPRNDESRVFFTFYVPHRQVFRDL